MKKMFSSFLIALPFLLISLFLVAKAQALSAMTTSNLNVRNGSGVQHDIQSVIPAHTRIDVTYCSEKWCAIEQGKKIGWISKAYLAFSTKDSDQNNNSSSELGNYWQDKWYWNTKD